MGKLRELLRGARRIELFLIAACAAILLLLGFGSGEPAPGRTELESRLCAVLERVDGVGRTDVMITEGPDGDILGILVVAEGADDIALCLKIQYAVQTLLNVDASRVEIVRSAR